MTIDSLAGHSEKPTFKDETAEKLRESAPLLMAVVEKRFSSSSSNDSTAAPFLTKLTLHHDFVEESAKQLKKDADKTSASGGDASKTDESKKSTDGQKTDETKKVTDGQKADETKKANDGKNTDAVTKPDGTSVPSDAAKHPDVDNSKAEATKQRDAYRKEVEKLLDQENRSDKVQHGEGYYQVLKRMNPGMSVAELDKLSHEVKAVNGNRHVLHRGEQFNLLSDAQKKTLVDNMMNDYDRAHGKTDLKDGKVDPVCEKLASALKAKVEKEAEPDLKKSLEPPKVEQPKPEPTKPTDDGKKPDDKTTKPELPFEERVQKAEEACTSSYADVQRRAELAEYVVKHFDPQSDQYKFAMKGLAEGMAEEKKALIDLRELSQKQPDAELNKQVERYWKAFMKQQVQILNKLHDTSLMTDSSDSKSA
jgi:hypothetical protein